MLNPCPALFTSWEDDRWSLLLNTGFKRFTTGIGIDGMARVKDGNLEILALVSNAPGRGCLRRFIAEAKTQYEMIMILAIWNEWLPVVLERYGFTPFTRTDETGEKIDGMVWKKTKTES